MTLQEHENDEDADYEHLGAWRYSTTTRNVDSNHFVQLLSNYPAAVSFAENQFRNLRARQICLLQKVRNHRGSARKTIDVSVAGDG